MKSRVKFILSLVCLFFGSFYVSSQGNIMFEYYDQYVDLYPDCIDDEDSKIYSLEEPYLEEPEFPGGGQVQMTRYVYFSTQYPDVKGADGEQLKGKVLIRTVIDRCGLAGEVEVIQSLSDEHDAEAVRIVESFPIFKPAALDGMRVKVAMIVPVYFTKTYVPKKPKNYYDDGDDYYNDDYYNDDYYNDDYYNNNNNYNNDDYYYDDDYYY